MKDNLEFKELKRVEKNCLFQELREYNRSKRKARYVVRTHTKWVDDTLTSFLERFSESEKFCLVATGGYGRRQLNPASDVDILLVVENTSDFFEYLIRELYDFLYFLGYDCSVSIRSVEDCIRYALEDDTIKTSMVDSRLIYGSRSLFLHFKKSFKKYVIDESREEFIERKLEYMRFRYSKFGNTVFVLEPNIKEGVGSLRDYHTLLWISKVLFGVRNILETRKLGKLAFDDYMKFREALYFLWQVRNALHFESKKKNDVLYLDLRDKIADELGFSPTTRFSKAERFMRKYYYNTRNMERIVNTYIKSFLQTKTNYKNVVYFDDKVKGNGDLSVNGDIDFRQLLFLFYYAALYSKPISIGTLQRIKPLLPLVSKYRTDKTFSFVFKNILSLNVPVTRTIRMMHESGFLDRYIPEFGKVCCLTEDSLYHKYTVDEHSIQALGHLDRLYDYDTPKTFITRLSYIWKSLSPLDRISLRIAVLLHDIGKIEKKHHEVVGAEMIDKIAVRLRLGRTITKKVKFLVRNHLLISRIISTRDVEDKKTLEDFMDVVDDKSKLNLLVLLTYADMRAVNDNVWTSWKESLIEVLYLKATYAMENKSYDEYLRVNALKAKKEIISILGDSYSDLLDTFPDNIFSDIDSSNMAEYIRSIKDTKRNVFVYSESKELAKVVVYYNNEFGFFNKISGILACLDVNIISARSYDLSSNKVIDIFRIEIPDSGNVSDYLIEDMLSSVETGELDLNKCMEKKKEKFMTRLERAKLDIAIQNINIVVDNDLSDLYTVVRIYAPDRKGLVYYITKVFTEFRLQVGMFILDTKGTIAVDTFYVADEGMRKIYSQKIIDLLKSKLYEVLV